MSLDVVIFCALCATEGPENLVHEVWDEPLHFAQGILGYVLPPRVGLILQKKTQVLIMFAALPDSNVCSRYPA